MNIALLFFPEARPKSTGAKQKALKGVFLSRSCRLLLRLSRMLVGAKLPSKKANQRLKTDGDCVCGGVVSTDAWSVKW